LTRQNHVREHGPSSVAIVSVPTRKIRDLTRLLLFVRAGGRCEFDGCNRYLLEHHLTLTQGNFGELAHIVAFSAQGPRGGEEPRPTDINNVDNLMLLCPSCHKLIDDRPADFTREALERHKSAHEDRIKHVTALGPDRKTAVLVFKALIGGQTVGIPFDQIAEATAPRYPSTTNPVEIDLTGVPAEGAAFYRTACATIKQHVARLFAPEGEATRAGHASVFALGPIPLLICLGRQLTSKVPSDVYQRHRDSETWTWKTDGRSVKYRIRRLKAGGRRKVALVLSLSGAIRLRDLPASLRQKSTVYEITPQDQTPQPTFLRSRRDLASFRLAYQQAISTIVSVHGLLPAIDLFPAVPAPVAVLCGRELLPKVHPKLRIFDYDRSAGGFKFTIEV
jgi:hypothetical protein